MKKTLQGAKEQFVQSVTAFEAGSFDTARASFQPSLALVPGRVSTLTNLAHVGDLGPVFRAAASVMDGGGIFCFSAGTPEGDKDFELKTSLRYAHSRAYLRALVARHGFEEIKVLNQPIREDQRQAIAGQYWYLRRRY